MFNNIGLDIFIGLVFIFLLYSLLASIIAEMFATVIALRARNLKEAVDRMLNDDDNIKTKFWSRLWDTLKLTKNPNNPRITNFYNHPEIKYLGSTGVHKVPSQFKAFSFAKTVIYQLSGEGPADRHKIKEKLLRLKNRGTPLETPLLQKDEIGRAHV